MNVYFLESQCLFLIRGSSSCSETGLSTSITVFIMWDWSRSRTWAIRKGMRPGPLPYKWRQCEEQKPTPAEFWGAQGLLTEWRSGFNRYRRTWAGPELTTGPDASWRRTRAAKRDIPSHDVSFSFSRNVRECEDRTCVSLSNPYIYWQSPIGKQGQLPALYITLYAAISLLSAWSTNGPWDRQCGGYTKSSTGGTCNEKTGPRRTGMVGRGPGKRHP